MDNSYQSSAQSASGKENNNPNPGGQKKAKVTQRINDYESYYDRLSEIPVSLYQSDNLSQKSAVSLGSYSNGGTFKRVRIQMQGIKRRDFKNQRAGSLTGTMYANPGLRGMGQRSLKSTGSGIYSGHLRSSGS